MSENQNPKRGVNDPANISAFLSKILPAGTSRAPSAQAGNAANNVANKVGGLNISDSKATETKGSSADASVLQSTAVSNVASPQSKASDNIPPEKMSEWLHQNAPPDHFKSKNPIIGTVQAQDSPQGSPQTAGVMAPPPTPETISSLAIGKMISDELDRIPEERFMSLGDSRFAPKNQSRLSNVARPLASNDQFFSAVPRFAKPRDDSDYTRMSFKAADSPTVPSFILDSKRDTPPTTEGSSQVQGPPSTAEPKKENAPSSVPKDASSQTEVTNGAPKNVTPDPPYIAPHLRRPAIKEETKAFTASTPDTPKIPPAAPHLKPTRAEEIKASKVFTPDTPDDQLDIEQQQALRGGDAAAAAGAATSFQELRAQAMPFFPTTTIPHGIKEEPKDKPKRGEAPIAKPIINIKTTNLVAEESPLHSAGPLTPSSMTFTAVSPTKVRAAGITTANAQPAKIVGENLEGALYFKAWPSQPKSGERASHS
ncbi:MAG: hypothetical protein L6R39_007578, partial [Caloplaca ligustica]